MNRIEKENDNFSEILEKRISFISSYRLMTYKHYLKQKMPMYERKINQILHRDPTLINVFDRDLLHPLMNHYAHIPFFKGNISNNSS